MIPGLEPCFPEASALSPGLLTWPRGGPQPNFRRPRSRKRLQGLARDPSDTEVPVLHPGDAPLGPCFFSSSVSWQKEEGSNWSPSRRFRKKSSSLGPFQPLQPLPPAPAPLYRQFRRSPFPCWAATGSGERGEARGLGEGGHLSLVLPCREGAEGNRLGECRTKCLWQTEHNLAKPTKTGETGGCLSHPSLLGCDCASPFAFPPLRHCAQSCNRCLLTTCYKL